MIGFRRPSNGAPKRAFPGEKVAPERQYGTFFAPRLWFPCNRVRLLAGSKADLLKVLNI
jgi:hypothetical protein